MLMLIDLGGGVFVLNPRRLRVACEPDARVLAEAMRFGAEWTLL